MGDLHSDFSRRQEDGFNSDGCYISCASHRFEDVMNSYIKNTRDK